MKVAVLGGGAAGLAAGVALRRAGVEVALFEAEPSVGGKLRSFERDGFRCEDGPNSLTAHSPTALRLARELGVAIAEVQPPRTRYVFRRGKLRAAAPPSLVGLLSLGAWARLAVEPLAVLRARRDPQREESLLEFLTRHVGVEAGELASRLLAAGVYGGDPGTLSARDAFPKLSSLEQLSPSLLVAALRRSRTGGAKAAEGPRSLWIPSNGMSALAEALAHEIPGGVRVGARVEALDPQSRGHEVVLADGRLRVDGLVCALPPAEAARLLAPMAPAAAGLREIRSSPLAVVHLGFRTADFERAPRGFGLLDGDGSLRLLGALFPSSLFAGRAPTDHLLLTCLAGGILHPELLDLDDAALVALCCDDLRRLLGVARPPVFERVVRWREAVPQPELGHRERLARVVAALAPLPPVELAGAAYDGVAVEQVLAGGERAAARLLGRLQSGKQVEAIDAAGSPVESRVEV